MLRALQRGDVEIHRARVPFTAAGTRYPAGSHVILMSQPASAFANTLTDIQRYPDMRVSPGGAPQEAYDGTAYTVPLLMHVTVARVADPFEADLELVQSPVMAGRGSIVGGRATTAYAFAHDSAGIQALIRLAMDHVQVGWARTPFGPAGRRFSAGTIIVPVTGQPRVHEAISAIVSALSVTAYALSESSPSVWAVRLPRVGLYKSYAASLDEGWTRWILEQWGLPYSSLENRDLRGNRSLASQFDVIGVVPSPVEIQRRLG
jgi:hypothetical protein